MANAANIAHQAWKEKQDEKELERRRVIENAEQAKNQAWQKGMRLLARALSELELMFPCVKWEIEFLALGNGIPMDTGECLVISDEDNSMELMIIPTPLGHVESIHIVSRGRDRDTGYDYWSGPEIKSAADAGRYLSGRG